MNDKEPIVKLQVYVAESLARKIRDRAKAVGQPTAAYVRQIMIEAMGWKPEDGK